MANFNFNKVILGGRMVSDPELKQTQSGVPLATFRIAVNRRFGNRAEDAQQADFFSVTAWRQTAEFVHNFFRKGSSICVIGSIQMRQVTDQQGQKRTFTDIVADEVYFVDSKGEGPAIGPLANSYAGETYGQPSYSNAPTGIPGTTSTAPASPKFEVIDSADDLPF